MNKYCAKRICLLLVVFILIPLYSCKTYPQVEGYDDDIAEIIAMIDESRNSEPIRFWDLSPGLNYFKPWCDSDGKIIREITTFELKSSEVKGEKLLLGFHAVISSYSSNNEVVNNTDFITVELEKDGNDWTIVGLDGNE